MEKKEQDKYVELLEENYLMLKCLKNAQDSAHVMRETADLLEKTLVHIQREMDLVGYSSDLIERAQGVVESMKSTSETLIESYRVFKHPDDERIGVGEED